jgi:hypothetical protein
MISTRRIMVGLLVLEISFPISSKDRGFDVDDEDRAFGRRSLGMRVTSRQVCARAFQRCGGDPAQWCCALAPSGPSAMLIP